MTASNPFRQRSKWDHTFGETRTPLVVLFALVCPPVAVLLGLIGLFACQEEGARRKALLMMLIAGPLAAGLAFLVMMNQ